MRNYFPLANTISKRKPNSLRGKIWYENNKQKVYIANMKWRKKALIVLRYEVFSKYGGKCVCCNESNYGFLTIDHVDGGGQKDREKHIGKLGDLYHWLKANHYPRKGYRLMCMNCNWGSRITKVCPHKALIVNG